MTGRNKRNKSLVVGYSAFIIVGVILFFGYLGVHLHIPPKLLFIQLTNIFYKPHQNIIRVGSIAGSSIYIHIYFLIIIFMIFLNATNLLIKKMTAIHTLSSSSILLLVAFLFYFLITIFQTINISKAFIGNYEFYSGKSLEDKYSSPLDPSSYRFAKFCRDILPGEHSARFITDLNIQKDPGALIHRKLAYFLYPIDIRDIRKEPTDSMIIFRTDNAAKMIPKDFRILGVYNEHNLIAVKRGTTSP